MVAGVLIGNEDEHNDNVEDHNEDNDDDDDDDDDGYNEDNAMLTHGINRRTNVDPVLNHRTPKPGEDGDDCH